MESDAVDPYSDEGQVEEKVTLFLSTLRSENTRTLARQIVDFLVKKKREQWEGRDDERHEWGCGWIRSSEIFSEMKNPNPYTTTRLLRDLTEAKIIERWECSRVKGQPGKKPVFYRVPIIYDPLHFFSREELLNSIRENQKKIYELDRYARMYLLALEIFREFTGKNLEPLVIAKMEEKEKRTEAIITKIIGESYKDSNPCKSLL